jgi:NAD(P)-dependent dehydrogenase (short-subunit alcohol dehydrogenase family)
VAYDFAGKVAVVTGAGGGIGEVYAEALAASGASMVVADIDETGAHRVASSIRDRGGAAEPCKVDVARPASASAMAALADERFGGIDFLVNNAAIYANMKLDPLLNVDFEYIQRFLAVNVFGALVCTRACFRSMRKRGGGAIVNQSSTAAYMYAGLYGLSKAALNSLTSQLASELGPMQIRVNAIAPGPIDTEAMRSAVPEVYVDQIVSSLAIKRRGTPDDLVGMCQFLLSDEARWVTGAVVNVDGGQVMRP